MQGPHAATTRPQPRRRRWEMLGSEPNQGRVISRNHSMNSKLGTVQVWTETRDTRDTRDKGCTACRDLYPRPGEPPRLRMSLCVFWNRVVSLWWVVLGALGCSGPLAACQAWQACVVRLCAPPPPITCRHDGAQALVCGVTVPQVQRERTAPPEPPEPPEHPQEGLEG